jgi:pimeloyl-ACP methyl ester carboxylesterase
MKNFLILLTTLVSLNAFATAIPQGFTQEQVQLDGVKLNVYKGGTGEPLLLIHGYAQSALMWAPLMTQLKNKFTIIVPDLRGTGQSEAPAGGYDKVSMAGDMKNLLAHYNISKARVVGHDIGLMVAYAFAAKYPEMTEKLVLMDAFIPGVGSGEAFYNSPDIWHFRFHGSYPEQLVQGREKIFFNSLWEGFSARPGTFPEAAKNQYTAEYSRPGRMAAAWNFFKTIPQDAIVNKELAKTKLQMPVLAMGGEKSGGQSLVDSVKTAAVSVQGKVVLDCGHWMLEECRAETITNLENFL